VLPATIPVTVMREYAPPPPPPPPPVVVLALLPPPEAPPPQTSIVSVFIPVGAVQFPDAAVKFAVPI